uniref:Venom peptide HtAMP13 n=1 Tax=Hadogenes troglodytes TaxID=1577150 RepID=A0A1B3IJ70_9SCOR|nr:venom peptide HtAMP13 [Hadogenes troglodytes]
MKAQFAILVISMMLLQLIVQTESGFLGNLWEGIKTALGKRGLRNLDDFQDFLDSDTSDADLRTLGDMFR